MLAISRQKVQGPELGIMGPALGGVGGGRGLTARDAVCVVLISAIWGLVVQVFSQGFLALGLCRGFSRLRPERRFPPGPG